MKQNIQLDAKFSNIEKINPLFSRCDVAILATDLNRNNSFISKQTVENAIFSLYNIPIVAEYIEERDNFGGHGGKIEIKDDEIRYVQTTSPIGLVPESANVYWDKFPNENGEQDDYLIAEGCFLWTGRYEQANKLIGKKFGQSMEITVNDSDWTTYEGKKVMNIKDFTFSALCVLGISTEDDPNGHVEPCFKSASITAYSLDKDSFKNEFKQMMAELKYSLKSNFEKGGTGMEKNKEKLEEKEFEVTETEDEKTEKVEDNEKEEMAKSEPDKEPDGDENGEDKDDDGDGKKYELLESEFTKLKEQYSLLESEVTELRQFKQDKLHKEKEAKINEVFASVATELNEDELTPFKEKAFEIEVEDLKKELFALIGKKAFEAKPKESEHKNFSMSILGDEVKDTAISNSYDSIIKKYNK